MVSRDLIVVGASLGGVEALQSLAGQLPEDFPAAVAVVQHTAPDSPNALVDVLRRAGPLPAAEARDGEPLTPGRIYLSRPDHHLLVHDGTLRVVAGPRENRFRPAIDPLFRSAAVAARNRAIGVVLSGLLDDGASGLLAVKRCGGVAVVQNDALYPDMPRHARQRAPVDHLVPIAEMGSLLERLCAEEPPQPPPVPDDLRREVRLMERAMNPTGHDDDRQQAEQVGDLSGFTCPECGGALWQLDDEKERFRCHVGHSFTLLSLILGQNRQLEQALWSAMRCLEDRAKALDRLGQSSGVGYYEKADESRMHADRIRQLLEELDL